MACFATPDNNTLFHLQHRRRNRHASPISPKMSLVAPCMINNPGSHPAREEGSRRSGSLFAGPSVHGRRHAACHSRSGPGVGGDGRHICDGRDRPAPPQSTLHRTAGLTRIFLTCLYNVVIGTKRHPPLPTTESNWFPHKTPRGRNPPDPTQTRNGVSRDVWRGGGGGRLRADKPRMVAPCIGAKTGWGKRRDGGGGDGIRCVRRSRELGGTLGETRYHSIGDAYHCDEHISLAGTSRSSADSHVSSSLTAT